MPTMTARLHTVAAHNLIRGRDVQLHMPRAECRGSGRVNRSQATQDITAATRLHTVPPLKPSPGQHAFLSCASSAFTCLTSQTLA